MRVCQRRIQRNGAFVVTLFVAPGDRRETMRAPTAYTPGVFVPMNRVLFRMFLTAAIASWFSPSFAAPQIVSGGGATALNANGA